MKKIIVSAIIFSLTFAISCKKNSNEAMNDMTDSGAQAKPPVATKIPKELEIHDQVRIDNYYWLNERENQKVIDYLEEENGYYSAMTSHTDSFQEDLFE